MLLPTSHPTHVLIVLGLTRSPICRISGDRPIITLGIARFQAYEPKVAFNPLLPLLPQRS